MNLSALLDLLAHALHQASAPRRDAILVLHWCERDGRTVMASHVDTGFELLVSREWLAA